jgi:hypothetical protein
MRDAGGLLAGRLIVYVARIQIVPARNLKPSGSWFMKR